MIWIIIAMFLGILSGLLTGLIPGLHTNTIALIFVGASVSLLDFFTPLEVAVFLMSMVVVHSFVDFIPSIFLGAPEDATVLGVLPGHELLMKGRGYRAIKLTVMGGVFTFIFGLIFIPPMFWWLSNSYDILSKFIAPMLIVFSVLFILQEKSTKKKFWAAIIFLLAGILGLLVLNQLSIKQPLFPILSGLFGISTLFISLFNTMKIPNQITVEKIEWRSTKRILDYMKAGLSSLFVSIMPAIGAAQAAVISQAFTKFKDKEDFLVVLGGINTAAALFTLTTFFLIGRARTGVVAVIKDIVKLNFEAYLILVAVCFFAMIVGAILTLKLSKFVAKYVSKINYRKISLGVICFISILVLGFSGLIGLWVLLIATSIGILAPLVGVRRIHLMACLVVPVVVYYLL